MKPKRYDDNRNPGCRDLGKKSPEVKLVTLCYDRKQVYSYHRQPTLSARIPPLNIYQLLDYFHIFH